MDVVLRAPRRVNPIPLWRLRLAAFCVQLVVLLGVGMWTMSTDEVSAVAAAILHVHTLAQVRTDRPDVGVIVRAPADDVVRVASDPRRAGHPRLVCRRRGARARHDRSRCARSETNCSPKSPPGSSLLRWVRTSGTLHAQARALGLHHRFYFVTPRGGRTGGLTVGQLLLAGSAGATPVSGALRLCARGPLPQRPTRAGDVLVVGADGSGFSVRGVERLVSWLRADGLSAESLAALTRSR